MFQETIDKIKNALNDINGIILGDDYDAVLTKRLASTNLISENREADTKQKQKQSHIALSGKDSRDFFPYVNIFHYTDEEINDQKMKSFYVLQVPMILSEQNITKTNNNRANFDFLNGKVVGKPSVKLSRPGNSPQIELGNTTTSDDTFYNFRSLFYVNDVLVIFKKRQKLEYEAYIIKKDDAVSYDFEDSVLFFPNRLKATIVDLDEVTPKDVRLGDEEINYKTGIKSDFHHNRIIFGAPGTGKSYDINQDKDALLKNGGEYERVTFHPDYSYANFVGTYKPTMLDTDIDASLSEEDKEVFTVLSDKSKTAQEKYDLLYERFRDSGDGLTRLPVLLGVYTDETFKTLKQDGTPASGDNGVERNHGRAIRRFVNLLTKTKSKSEIAYEYVPGPFMRTYVKALKNAQTNNPRPYLLIVEEINRANVAAVFGDVFQLLDRDGDNVSEYGIQASEDIKKYLAKELGGKPQGYSEIRIPDNMFIWATMNSADQGVFPMDTAFKRRWNFDYLGINHNENDIKGNLVAIGSGGHRQAIEWNELRKAINNTLSSYKINEDKLLGPYFLSRKIIVPSKGNEINANIFNSAFKSKVLMYLFDDAAKQKRASLFDGCMDTTKYSSICEEFDERGVEIFCKEIRDKFPRKISMVAESPEEYK